MAEDDEQADGLLRRHGGQPRPVVEEVRLTAFRTFHESRLRLRPLTVMIGRNSSGKSNALDGLEVLSRLAQGEDIRDALDGRRRDTGPIRGGLDGCPPHGMDIFTLGCSIRTPERQAMTLDLTIRVRPEVRVVHERLWGPAGKGSKVLLETEAPSPGSGDIAASWYNGKQGPNPHTTFRSSRLATAQVATRLPLRTAAERAVAGAADHVLSALRGVFRLDPVPHLMRHYVPQRDSELRRTAENLSASVANLERRDHDGFARPVSAVRDLTDHEIRGLQLTRAELGDVMLALDEGEHGLTPAREMSDGMLRFIAIIAALLSGEHGVDIDSETGVEQSLTLVIEELENGLHPSQTSTMLRMLRDAASRERTQVLTTTHSPALMR